VDAGNLIYIVAVIIYFIYSALKKDKNLPSEPGSTEELPEQRRPASFEDLLKEIRQSQQEREKDFDHAGQGANPSTAGEIKRNTYQTIETESRPVQKKAEPNENPKKTTQFDQYQGEMSGHIAPKLQKLDDQVQIEVPSGRLKAYDLVKDIEKSEHYYSKLLKDPQTVKDAVILGEILNRKHF
jgi:hypothetical protein